LSCDQVFLSKVVIDKELEISWQISFGVVKYIKKRR
jgi:hypothetical protein